MPVITKTVQLYDGFTLLSAATGVIDVDEDRQVFMLSKIDNAGNRIETVLNAPINQVVVRGQATRLRFLVGGVRKMVDFSLGSTLVQGFGLAGEIVGGSMNSKSGVNQVVAALRKGGAQVHYWSYWKRVGLIWLIVIGFFVVIFAVIALAALASR